MALATLAIGGASSLASGADWYEPNSQASHPLTATRQVRAAAIDGWSVLATRGHFLAIQPGGLMTELVEAGDLPLDADDSAELGQPLQRSRQSAEIVSRRSSEPDPMQPGPVASTGDIEPGNASLIDYDVVPAAGEEVLYDLSELPPVPPAYDAAFADDVPAKKADAGEAKKSETSELEKRLKKVEDELKKSKEASDKSKKDNEKKTKDALLKPSVNWTGQLQVDSLFSDQSADNRELLGPIEDGVGFRRARLGATGDVNELTEYRIEMEFAFSGRPSFLDNWIGVKDAPYVGQIRVGRFFEPFSLDRLTANRFLTFNERSLMDAFAPARRTGAAFLQNFDNRNATISGGVFRSLTDDYGDDYNDSPSWSATGRVTWAPGFDDAEPDHYVHIGTGYSFRGVADRNFRLQQRPEARYGTNVGSGPLDVLFPAFVDTGTALFNSSNAQLWNGEAAWVNGPLSIQSEYTLCSVDRNNGGNVLFSGAYIFASYFLTGEYRPYNRPTQPFRKANGTFDRLKPKTNFLSGPGTDAPKGIGAWEVAARWSYIDLDSLNVNGGKLQDVTLGLNWYWNPYTRVSFNYVHAMLKRGPELNSTADLFVTRFGFDF